MEPDAWFALLRETLAEQEVDVPEPAPGEIDTLLDLARIAAHTSERWTAPISGFLVGAALAGRDAARRADGLRALLGALEADDRTRD